MVNCQLVETPSQLRRIQDDLEGDRVLACDLESTGLDTRTVSIEGIGIGNSEKQYFISTKSLDLKKIGEALKDLFKDREIVFHNAKYDLKLLGENDLPWPEKIHDTMMMAWLIDEEGQHGLKPLTKAILGRDPGKWTELDRNPTLFKTAQDIMEELSDYCGADIKNTFDLYIHFKPLLQNEGLYIDYEKVELPLIKVLARMEMRGVQMNIDWLELSKKELKKELVKLEKKMRGRLLEEDRDINIHSPKQLEHLLFDVFKYAPIKITNGGGRSTDNGVLKELVKQEKLKDHDFVPLLLKFRDLDKIYRTYLVGLSEQADENGVIHANFLQHRTRTGRLASNEPNLQNIPTRVDRWNIRQAFIPRKGYKFVIADYSQIELRMLAHFSQDENMVKTFNEGGDIHAKTMELTKTKRRVAKAINFGLIYGMGPNTLANTLDIKEADAKKYISKFFAGYPQVRNFIERIQQRAFVDGYVGMITGRRRRFHEIKDRRWYGMIKRQSINTKIQGSAADLIKIAMIKLEEPLNALGAYQLIQIHDEVIVEAPVGKVKAVTKVMTEVMESALKLRVPIKVGIGDGDCWFKD